MDLLKLVLKGSSVVYLTLHINIYKIRHWVSTRKCIATLQEKVIKR